MNLNEIGARFNIDVTNPATAIMRLRDLYESSIEDYKNGKEAKSSEAAKKVLSEVGANPVSPDIAQSVFSAMKGMNLKDLNGLYAAMVELTQHVRSVRDDYLAAELSKRGTSVSDDILYKEDLAVIGDAIRAYYALLTMTGGLPSTFPTKRLDKSGETVPVLSKLQGHVRGESGRGVASKHLTFVVDGVDCHPAMMAGTYGPSLSSRHVFKAVQDAGLSVGEGDWEIKLEGKVISCRID